MIMNRFRRLAGINSYQSELGARPDELVPGGGRWLDIGCGTGVAVREFARARPDATVVALDIEAGLYDGRATTANLHLLQADAARLPILGPGVFDLITAVHVLHFLDDKQGVLRRLESFLRPGGTLGANLDPLDVWIGPSWEQAQPLGGVPQILRSAPSWGTFVAARSAPLGNRQGVVSRQSLYFP